MKNIVLLVSACLIAAWCIAPGAYAQVGDAAPEYDERVKASLEEKDVVYSIDSDGDFKVEFETEGDRTQLAFIISQTYEYGNFEIREIHAYAYEAPGGEFPPAIMQKLLEDSFTRKLGAWAIVDNYAVFVTRIAADADAESLWNALVFTLESADEMEAELSGDTDAF